jgi:putative phosphoesterase
MHIAIISDVHNNTTSLKKVLDYCRNNNIEKIICCGDLGSMETLDFLNDNFSGEIYFCFGNMDDGHLKNYDFEAKYKNTRIFQDYGEFKIDNRNIALVHYPEAARELCETGKYTHVFYGHTHKPWEEMVKRCKMLNPGNVAGEIYPPTFAVWDTDDDKFELIRIHELK